MKKTMHYYPACRIIFPSVFQNPEEAVKEFLAENPILTEIEAKIKYYLVRIL